MYSRLKTKVDFAQIKVTEHLQNTVEDLGFAFAFPTPSDLATSSSTLNQSPLSTLSDSLILQDSHLPTKTLTFHPKDANSREKQQQHYRQRSGQKCRKRHWN